jgi:glucan phosphoethanolaminetransferase (alkaline phosphatase superfamily)
VQAEAELNLSKHIIIIIIIIIIVVVVVVIIIIIIIIIIQLSRVILKRAIGLMRTSGLNSYRTSIK